MGAVGTPHLLLIFNQMNHYSRDATTDQLTLA